MHRMKAIDCPAALQQQPPRRALFFCCLFACAPAALLRPTGINLVATRAQHRGCTAARVAAVYLPNDCLLPSPLLPSFLPSALSPGRPGSRWSSPKRKKWFRDAPRDCVDAMYAPPLSCFLHAPAAYPKGGLIYMNGGRDGSDAHRFV